MGFKDLIDYNTALLTKIVWRAHNSLEALWVKVLKGLYFPIDSFMKTNKGSRAPWCWSGMLGRKGCLEQSCQV